MKTSVKTLKVIDYYDGFVSGTLDTKEGTFFLFLLAYDINGSRNRCYGAIKVTPEGGRVLKGVTSETYKECEKVMREIIPKAEVVYLVTSEPSLNQKIEVQDLDFIEMKSEQIARAIKYKPDFIDEAVLDESIAYWFKDIK